MPPDYLHRVEELMLQGLSLRAAAREVGRSPSTVSIELRKHELVLDPGDAKEEEDRTKRKRSKPTSSPIKQRWDKTTSTPIDYSTSHLPTKAPGSNATSGSQGSGSLDIRSNGWDKLPEITWKKEPIGSGRSDTLDLDEDYVAFRFVLFPSLSSTCLILPRFLLAA